MPLRQRATRTVQVDPDPFSVGGGIVETFDVLRPIIRWAGGKSVMVKQLAALAPPHWNRYIEPMLGGGAMFFHMRPPRAILADVNHDLIGFYSTLRDKPRELVRELLALSPSRRRYYELRGLHPRGRMRRAVRFAYLNRLAWNGLYRVNRRGEFNVPIGDRLPPSMWIEKNLTRAASALTNVELLAADFRETLACAQSGDFVYLDPPYPRGSADSVGFNRYDASFFSMVDHQDVARIVAELTGKSVMVMVTVSDVPHLERLYPRSMRRTTFLSKSLIACNGRDRKHVSELILTNY